MDYFIINGYFLCDLLDDVMTNLDLWIEVFKELDYVVIDVVREGPVHSALFRKKNNFRNTIPKSNILPGDAKIYINGDTDEVMSLSLDKVPSINTLSNAEWFYQQNFWLFRQTKIKLLGI